MESVLWKWITTLLITPHYTPHILEIETGIDLLYIVDNECRGSDFPVFHKMFFPKLGSLILQILITAEKFAIFARPCELIEQCIDY